MLNELQNFETASLEDCGKIAFQNRFDTKFVLKIGGVLDFLRSIPQNYSLLSVADSKIQNYNTIYFDTPDLLCFNMHKNRRANRFKFRTRQYLSNGKIYNEIKKKLNTGKTLKFRQKREVFSQSFDAEFAEFLKTNGLEIIPLISPFSVEFSRIALLNKQYPERITVDFGIKYATASQKILLSDTAIVEIKRERNAVRSFSQEYFRSKHILPSGFSKYCIGICLTDDGDNPQSVKKNLFLPKIKNLLVEREML